MTNALWFLLVGALLLARGLTATMLSRLPATPAFIYLAAGLLVRPTVLNVTADMATITLMADTDPWVK